MYVLYGHVEVIYELIKEGATLKVFFGVDMILCIMDL